MKKQTNLEQSKPNEDRFYCNNKNLLRELFKWKNSTQFGIPVMKLKKDANGKILLIPTEIDNDTMAIHEKYKQGTKYAIKYKKTNERYQFIKDSLQKIEKRLKKNAKLTKKQSRQKINIIKETPTYIIEDVTEKVKGMGYAFDIDDNEKHRTISEELGQMMIDISNKISNHSSFRNYDEGTKQECQSYAKEKIIRGLPNYNFKYDNVFAYMSQACFNSFKSILSKYYKHINLRRALTKKYIVEMDSTMPNSSISKCLNNQFKGNDFDDFSSF